MKYLLMPLFGIALIFGVLLFLNNSTAMTVEMSTPQKQRLSPQLYFASAGEAYSEEHSVRPSDVQGNIYRFALPDLEHIALLRFDPAGGKREITISNITIIEKHWFRTTYYDLPLQALKPAAQIKDFLDKGSSVTFSTVESDPQLNVTLTLQHKSTFFSLQFHLLLTALIIYLLIVFLWKLYQQYDQENFPTAKVILYALFFSLALFKTVYYKDEVRFGYPPDELAHLSYIAHVHNKHDFIPDYKHMTMINNRHRGNYLSHPSFYYELMNLVYDEHTSAKGNVDNFRTLSLLIFMLSFLLILSIGFRAKLSILGDFVFLSFLSSVPMYAYIGASISNDTLAILGTTLFALGLKRLVEKEYTTMTYVLILLGVLVAYFSKLTAALLIFFALLFFFAHMLFTRQWIVLNKMQVVLIGVILVPIVYYQLNIMMEYHSLVPTFNVTHPQQYLDSPFYVQEAYRQHLSPAAWLERMIHYIEGGWFGIHSHHSFTKESWIGYAGLLILHVFALIALLIPCKAEQRGYCLLGKFTLMALFAVLVVQYLFSYKAHLNSGYMGGLQPRYLLPFMFSFAIMSSIFVERFKNISLFTIAVILICIQAIYSDFFYFLLYYT